MKSFTRMHPVPRSSFFGVALATLAGLAACGGTAEIVTPAKDLVPASVTAVSTDTLRGVVGAAASGPLSVIVKNKTGEALDTTLVTFAVVSGNGTVSSAAVRTNATGQASTTWTLGSTVGLQTVTATVGSLTPITFTAVATVGAATTMTKVAGDAQSAPINTNVAVAPQVKLVDRFGNPVPGVSVAFTVGLGGGSVNGGVSNTNAAGVATVASWRVGSTVGNNSLTATAGALSVSFTATGTVGAPAALTLTPATIPEMSVGQTQQLTTRVADAAGNVIASPTITFTSSSNAVAAVTSGGLITATGAGTAVITATSGTATANVALSVIGHPTGTVPVTHFDYGFITPSDVAFTKSGMFVAVNGSQKVYAYDANGTGQTGIINVLGQLPMLLAPTNADGPVIAISVGTQSRLWFINPSTMSVVDSLDINDVVTSAAILSNGQRAYMMLANGEIAAIDVQARQQLGRISIGGAVTRIRVAPGDTTLYVLTSVGAPPATIEIDTRSNTIRRQIFANTANTDLAISREGLFYLLDGPNSVVRILDINTGTVLRTVGISANGTTLAVSPDGQQIWVTHSQPAQVTMYTGNRTTGYLSTGTYSFGQAFPSRVYINPSGSAAVVSNLSGWIDIFR